MKRQILVPIDLSQTEAGAGALAAARRVDGPQGNDITLLNVVSNIPDYVVAQIPTEVMEDFDKNAAEDLGKFAKENGLADQARVVVRTGHPAREILEYAESHDVDMIVIASHDPGWQDYLLGSVAGKVVRHAHCSVFVVRGKP